MSNDQRESGKQQVIGIIGGGISGLLACKYCISKGFDPIVFESESSIGGVWTKTIGSTKLQTPKPLYQFSDFPWPDSVTELFPDHQTVLDYIESYARHFDLLRHIQFNNKVLSLSYDDSESERGTDPISWAGEWTSKGKWNVTVQDTPTLSIKVIGIIGAGVSGLLACKYCISKGFDPIVFESESSIGGVWTKTIGSTKLQTPKPLYQFSDFPWPDSVTELFPDHQTVLDYIESYAHHFDLIRHIHFNTKVLSLSYEDGGGAGEWNLWSDPFNNKSKWNVTVLDAPTLSTRVYQVDFVVVCVGRFGQVPNIPEFPPNKGPEAFEGKVIHSMDYSKMDSKTAADFVKGKKVAVVGFQKSGIDIAMECSAVNGVERPCTVVIRTPHWNLPDYSPWGFPLAKLYLNRFSELMVHKPGEGLLLSLLATALSPLRWAFSKFVESYIKHKNRLTKYGTVPEHSFLKDLSSCTIAIVPEDFYDRVEEGSIKLIKKAETFGFSKEGIVFEVQADPIKSDLVILATGFKGIDKLKHIFESPKYREFIAGSVDSAVPLYRECIHPRIPQAAIIGFSESIANLYTSEIRCRWLAELLDGKFKLPSIKVMEKDIAEWNKYKKRYSHRNYNRISSIAALHVWHNDQLCKDMGWNPKRKKGLWAELFEPYGPMDYAGPI